MRNRLGARVFEDAVVCPIRPKIRTKRKSKVWDTNAHKIVEIVITSIDAFYGPVGIIRTEHLLYAGNQLERANRSCVVCRRNSHGSRINLRIHTKILDLNYRKRQYTVDYVVTLHASSITSRSLSLSLACSSLFLCSVRFYPPFYCPSLFSLCCVLLRICRVLFHDFVRWKRDYDDGVADGSSTSSIGGVDTRKRNEHGGVVFSWKRLLSRSLGLPWSHESRALLRFTWKIRESVSPRHTVLLSWFSSFYGRLFLSQRHVTAHSTLKSSPLFPSVFTLDVSTNTTKFHW